MPRKKKKKTVLVRVSVSHSAPIIQQKVVSAASRTNVAAKGPDEGYDDASKEITRRDENFFLAVVVSCEAEGWKAAKPTFRTANGGLLPEPD